MRMATALAAVVFALLVCVSAVADIPEVISYQGVLKDDAGVPVADGTYDITFRLYDVETGGTVLWQETQSLFVEDAIINAYLGSVVTLTGLDFLVPYWLGIEIEAEGELIPRTMWTTVPYAAHASFADGITNEGGWKQSGDDVYRDFGNVGVGLAPVDARLDVFTGDGIAGDFDSGSTTVPTLRAHNAGGTAGAFYSCVDTYPVPTPYAAVYGRGACGARGGDFYSSSGEALYATTTGVTTALVAEAAGTGYAAQFLGISGIQVQYQADVGSFRMFGGSSPGYVMTSDADGVGTWQEPAAVADGDWVFDGDNLLAGNLGRVGIGTVFPGSKLEVENDEAFVKGLTVRHGASTTQVVDVTWTGMPSAYNDVLQLAVPAGAPDDFQFIECERGTVPAFQVQGNGRVVSSSGASFADDVTMANAKLVVTDVVAPVVEVSVSDPTATSLLSVIASDAGGTMDGAAVYGNYVQSTDYGIGGRFIGGWRGVFGSAESVGGVYPHYGVYGSAAGSSGSNYGIYGYANTLPDHYAGYFVGNAHVTSTFTAGVKSFKIDHPLDPANKYLLHSCVESDEMKNVYDGMVVLDGRGEARVQLPDWFEALNVNFRYQLTCIGSHAPVYVAEEVSGGTFAIAGGTPGMKVSWQVTGVRNDPLAREQRVVVEQDKPAHELGKYMHPEPYGMPLSAGVDYENSRGEPQQSTPVEIEPREPFDPTDGE